MKNGIQILISISLVFFYSCSWGVKKYKTPVSPINNTKNLLTINIDKAEEVKNIPYSSLFKSPKSIIFESHENCLIKSVGGVQVYGNRIYILDKDTKNLFVYDMNGVFQQTIGSVGYGPGEFLSISDFTMDAQGNIIYLLDDYVNNVHKYDAVSGKFIEKIKIEVQNFQVSGIQYVSGSIYSNSIPVNEDSENHLLMKINAVNGDREAIYLDFNQYNKGSKLQLRNIGGFFYSRNTNSPKYIEMFMDTILSISKDQIVPVFAIKSKNFVNNQDLDEANKTYMEQGVHNLSSIFEKEKLFNINNYIEFGNVVCFQYMKGDSRFYLLYDTVTQKVKITKFFINDYIKSDNRIPMELCFNDEILLLR
jgi:hypothetical protein